MKTWKTTLVAATVKQSHNRKLVIYVEKYGITPTSKYTLFYKQRFFSTQPQCCLTFPWIELQMLLRCCLIHITTITLEHILYLVYLSPCLGQGLFLSLWSIFIFKLIFIVINHITSLKQAHSCYCWMITWMKKGNNFQTAKVTTQGVA